MSIRHIAAMAALLSSPLAVQQQRTKPVSQAEVDRITRDAILIDTRDDITSKTVQGYDIANPNKTG